MRKTSLTSKSVLFQEFLFFLIALFAVAGSIYLLINQQWLILVIIVAVFLPFRGFFKHLPRVVSIDNENIYVSKLLIFSEKIPLAKLKELKWESPFFVLILEDGSTVPVQDQWDTDIMPGYAKEVRERELRRKMSSFIKL